MSVAQCTVCSHPNRKEIDAALAQGRPQRRAADDWGLSKDAVRRHVNSHLSASLVRMRAKRDDAGVTTALERLERLYDRASAVLAAAEADGKASLSLQAIRELRAILETLARITGELDERPTVTVNLADSAEWRQVQVMILAALTGFPDARQAVARALASADLIAGEVEA